MILLICSGTMSQWTHDMGHTWLYVYTTKYGRTEVDTMCIQYGSSVLLFWQVFSYIDIYWDLMMSTHSNQCAQSRKSAEFGEVTTFSNIAEYSQITSSNIGLLPNLAMLSCQNELFIKWWLFCHNGEMIENIDLFTFMKRNFVYVKWPCEHCFWKFSYTLILCQHHWI